MKKSLLLFSFFVFLASVSMAGAELVTIDTTYSKTVQYSHDFGYIGSDHIGILSASATFSMVQTGGGYNLQIVLSNTRNADMLYERQLLTALFFYNQGTNLTPVSALLNGSTVYEQGDAISPQPTSGNVGGEWAYRTFTSGLPHGANAGISSAGFSDPVSFGKYNFNGSNLAGPDSVDGGQYGILSMGDDPSTKQSAGIYNNPEIKYFSIFQLALPANVNTWVLDTNKVSFQYGTEFPGDPNLHAPIPSSALLLGSGILGLGLLGWRRQRS